MARLPGEQAAETDLWNGRKRVLEEQRKDSLCRRILSHLGDRSPQAPNGGEFDAYVITSDGLLLSLGQQVPPFASMNLSDLDFSSCESSCHALHQAASSGPLWLLRLDLLTPTPDSS
ncbi:hypothetical protein HPB50_009657 [Hyalomma asiaticum]|uniref:Uncharacterized protein n=1 Tax=Hyalomma asiaticum TaxID=266040 RepID=A0ACB7S5S4_HYAAI|nr:hypothetical protein HPB50_009657 [Hyalomma asiaticum]